MKEIGEFCMTQFKPVVAGIVGLLLIVITWTIYHEIHRDRVGQHVNHVVPHQSQHHQIGQPGKGAVKTQGAGIQKVAAGGIPIQIGQLVPHAFYGNDCLKCHSIAGGDQKPPIPDVPIKPSAIMPHPFWGVCTKCHEIIGQQTKPVAFLNVLDGKNILGADFIGLNPTLAKQYNLPAQQGLLVNAVEQKSLAELAGLQEGDIVVTADRQDIQQVSELMAVLAAKQEGDKLKLKIIRNKKRRKNIKIRLTNLQTHANVISSNIGIMSTGPTLKSQVALSFINSPYLLVYNVSTGSFHSVINPFRGMGDNKVSSWVLSNHVSQVIVGNINDQDFASLSGANVGVYTGVLGKASDGVAMYQEGKLTAKPVAQVVQAAFNANTVSVVAIPSNYPDPSANISTNFASTRYFIIVELDKNKYEVVANPNFNDTKGVERQSVQLLVDNKVDAVIANQVAPKSLAELQKMGLHLVDNVDMSVGDAILNFKNSKLTARF